jgi:hypothetical protein
MRLLESFLHIHSCSFAYHEMERYFIEFCDEHLVYNTDRNQRRRAAILPYYYYEYSEERNTIKEKQLAHHARHNPHSDTYDKYAIWENIY